MLQPFRKGVKKMSSNTIGQRRQAQVRPVAANESLEPRWMLSASVLSYHNDAASDGQNTQETVLTPSNVNSTSFGKVFTTSVDGNVLAQPLFMPGLNIAGGVHNVVFVATEHDSVYALDGGTGQVLWHVSLLTTGLPGATSITTQPSADTFLNTDRVINPEVGITCTPVIDSSSKTLYVVAATKEIVNGVAHYVQRLHALNILTGAEKLGGPVLLGDTTFVNNVYTNNSPLWVNGTGDGNDGHGHVFFNVLRQLQRSALTFANGQIYIAWSSYSDIKPYHGWVASFNATTLALTGVLNTTPNGSDGSIWMSGGKLAADQNGNLYFQTGNGTFDGSNSTGTITGLNAAGFPVNGDYGDSVVKIAADTVHNSPSNQNINGWGLQVADYFTPYNQATLDSRDRDLASGGVALLPAAAGDAAHPNLLLAGGKQGRIYLLDQGDLGKFSASQAAEATHVVVETNPSKLGNSIYSTPSYFNQQFYYVPELQTGKQFFLPNGKAHFKTTPVAVTPDTFGLHDATTSISSNGLTNGIVWAVDFATNELRAYLASNFNDELYTSAQAAGNRDALGTVNHFPVPTVVNGHVYVGTSNSIVGFGLLNPPATTLAQLNPGVKTASTVTSSPGGANNLAQDAFGTTSDQSPPRVFGLPIGFDNPSGAGPARPPVEPSDSSEPRAPAAPIDWPWIGQGVDADPTQRLDWLFPF
jgi:hypothetical protein